MHPPGYPLMTPHSVPPQIHRASISRCISLILIWRASALIYAHFWVHLLITGVLLILDLVYHFLGYVKVVWQYVEPNYNHLYLSIRFFPVYSHYCNFVYILVLRLTQDVHRILRPCSSLLRSYIRCSPSAQVKAAAAHIRRLEFSQWKKKSIIPIVDSILGNLTVGNCTILPYTRLSYLLVPIIRKSLLQSVPLHFLTRLAAHL